SPGTNDAKHAALGLSVLPPGCITPTHSHEAEEVAVVIEGKGSIEINRSLIAVKAGSVVFTPSNLPHRTMAEDALTIFWLYSPAGSEQRWISGEAARKDEK
ncbi:MAG TPA: cupin domain-containing protein, partial [Acidimicrobiia bacterium]